ncbi:predicted protein [Nematostella vectensis]|uniref:B30.2/SPRY domain-containing protein n=1 Tax=Nematostella vectensis TaxID=45351 RepID=A7S7T1_NEMVE|nr:predicted protein [Nematostella vectensis]|eukprot:XP_001632356.1 predicted protein [Nematostella vectensis]
MKEKQGCTVGSRRQVEPLPLPSALKEWIREYEEEPRFDRKLTNLKHVMFSADETTVTFKGTSFYSTTMIKTPYGRGYISGKHEWVFYFDNCMGQVAVCVVPAKFKEGKNFNLVPYIGHCVGWCFNQVGRATYELPLWEEKRYYSSLFNSWDMVWVLLDMDKGTLGFMVNGKELGVAFSEGIIGNELFPAICLCGEGEKATIISSSTYL